MTNLSIMSNYMKAETDFDDKSSFDLPTVVKLDRGRTYVSGRKLLLYPCARCDKVFHHQSSLYRHVKLIYRSGGGTTVFGCNHPGCVKIFNQSYGLYRHFKLEHNGEKPYKCFECDQMFA